MFDGPVGVLHVVDRLKIVLKSVAALLFTVLPFSFLLLDVRAVTKHDAAQIGSRVCAVDLPPEAPRI